MSVSWSVPVVTRGRQWAGRPRKRGSIPGIFFYSPKCSNRFWVPSSLGFNGQENLFPPGFDTDHSPLSSAQLKEGRSYTSCCAQETYLYTARDAVKFGKWDSAWEKSTASIICPGDEGNFSVKLEHITKTLKTEAARYSETSVSAEDPRRRKWKLLKF
jgi:hypothetical protein